MYTYTQKLIQVEGGAEKGKMHYRIVFVYEFIAINSIKANYYRLHYCKHNYVTTRSFRAYNNTV